MQETRRQACLDALGVTPWVARRRLPGAAETPVLERVTASPQPEGPVSEPTPASEAESPRPAVESGAEPPAQVAVDSPTQSTVAPTAATVDQGLRFTFRALATPGVLLVIQQADPDAPEPGRNEQGLLDNLLRYFGASRAGSRSLAWPLPGARNEAEQARATLEAFVERRCNDENLTRVLWLLDEDLAQTLLGTARYRGFAWMERQCLAVAGLQEMLADPARHKAASWQAMVRHGFTA